MQQQGQQGAARPAGTPGAAPAGVAMQMPFPLIQNIQQLSELSGIPVHVLGNPAMQLAAQQLVAQRLVQQQMMAGGQIRPGMQMMPAQMLAQMQQAQQAAMQQRMSAAAGAGAAAGGKKGSAGKKRGGRGAAAAAAPSAAAMFAAAAQQRARPADPSADPGGKVVWAKVSSFPWWPAKTMDPQRDLSYPPDADPPRPTSIPIRFFGTFEFQWIGSKRALTDWDQGFAQFTRECDQASFKAAVEEAQRYIATGKLPDVFYTAPEPAQSKAKARGAKKRAAPRPAVPDAAELMTAAAAGAPGGSGKAVRAAGRAAEPAEDRSVVVQRRKKQRLQDLGLLPPDDSPYTGGRLAPNPNLLARKAEWEQQYAGVIAEHQQQQEAVAAARAAAAAAKARAAEEAKQAAAAAAATAAAAAAAAVPAAGAVFAAAMQPGQVAAQPNAALLQQQQMFMRQMMLQMQGAQSAAALPRRGVDQVLPHHSTPELYEDFVTDARQYTQLCVAANGPLPRQRGYDYPWGVALQDVQDKQPDARIINLETAVTTHLEPWPRKGINYRMHPGNVPTLTSASIDVCCLANNHVADWGREGLLETLDVLQGAGIQTAGAGRDLSEAEAPAVVPLPPDASGRRGRLLIWAIGHSSSGVPAAWAAGPRVPGVFCADLSPAGVRHLADLVTQHKQPGDVAMVSVHWGSNWGFEVPAEQRRFAHALVDVAGVDIVHGHSSHHAKGAEVYAGRLVLYGAGDLISDYEGISNSFIEAEYPPERYRDDVGVLWYADVSLADGRLRQLTMTPTRLKKLALHPPEPEDLQYIRQTLDRECRKLGGSRGVRPTGRGSSLVLDLEGGPEE